MEWFAQSSKFYIDLDDQGVSEAAQTLLMRACGYMADNETSGYLAKSALKKLGLSRVSRRVDELVRERIMIETVDSSGYDFPGWLKWNEPLERQVKKRKADRQRVAEKRASGGNVARHPSDKNAMSHDHIDSNKNKEKTNHLPEASHVSTAGDPDVRDQPGRQVPVDGWKLVRDLPGISNLPQATKSALAIQASTLLHAGTEASLVAQALDLWMTKPTAGPGLLPHLVAEVVKTANAPLGSPRPSTTDQRVAQAQALKRPEWGDTTPSIFTNPRMELEA